MDTEGGTLLHFRHGSAWRSITLCIVLMQMERQAKAMTGYGGGTKC